MNIRFIALITLFSGFTIGNANAAFIGINNVPQDVCSNDVGDKFRQSSFCQNLPLLRALYFDMSFYHIDAVKKKLDDGSIKLEPNDHRGHLPQHSGWTGLRMEEVIARGNNWFCPECCGLHGAIPQEAVPLISNGVSYFGRFSDREKKVLTLAAYIHDIGKAGDPNAKNYFHDGNKIFFTGKRDHELIGFYYIISSILSKEAVASARTFLTNELHIDDSTLHEYLTVESKLLNIGEILTSIGFSVEEQKLIAILIATHKMFIDLCANHELLQYNKRMLQHVKMLSSEKEFLMLLKKLFEITQLDQALFNPITVSKMIIALNMVDTYSVYYPCFPTSQSSIFTEGEKLFLLPTRNFIGPRQPENHNKYCYRLSLAAGDYESRLLHLLDTK